MRISRTICAALLLTACYATPALADDDGNGFYIGAQGGYNLLSTENYKGATGTHNVKFDYDGGWAAGVFLGYDFGNISTEFEFTRRKNNLGTVSVVTDGGIGSALGVGPLSGALTPTTGTISANSYMWNVYYNFNPENKTHAFAGVGIGISSLKLTNIGGGGIPALVAGQKDESFTAQGIFGIKHKLSEKVSLVLSYRYTYIDKVQFNVATSLPVNGKLNNHTLMAGLVISFGKKKAAPPPPPPPAPAPVVEPAPPPPEPVKEPEPVTIPGPFLVFFDWDSDELDDQAMATLREAAAAYNEFGIARIVAVGHADRSGPEDYNVGLSERRALAVEQALAGLGISADVVNTDWRGETEPRVQTADGVRERQNRRVEITLVK